MGAAGSVLELQNLPDQVSKEKCMQIAGPRFDESKYQECASSTSGVLTKEDFLKLYVKESGYKTDVFLSHDWGEGSRNHKNVDMINTALKNMGLKTWFDSDQMEGDIAMKMADGIEKTRCVLVFVTGNYHNKVQSGNPSDNCFKEFQYASKKKTSALMIPIVMEPGMRDTSQWSGPVGFELSNLLYCDMCIDWSNEAIVEQKVNELIDSFILKKITYPLSYLLGEASPNELGALIYDDSVHTTDEIAKRLSSWLIFSIKIDASSEVVNKYVTIFHEQNICSTERLSIILENDPLVFLKLGVLPDHATIITKYAKDKEMERKKELENLALAKRLQDEKEAKEREIVLIKKREKEIENAARQKLFQTITEGSKQQIKLKNRFPFDENGLFYYLGTNEKSMEYRNPHDTNQVVATMSSNGGGLSCAKKIVGRANDGYNFTMVGQSDAWLSVNIGHRRRLLLDCYCLKHDQNPSYYLRNWELQGKNVDDKHWTPIMIHVDDNTINGPYEIGTWKITTKSNSSNSSSYKDDDSENAVMLPYQYFRIYQTGLAAGNATMLCCGGLELYGTLYVLSKDVHNDDDMAEDDNDPTREATVECTYKYAFDDNGVVRYIGTAGNTRTFINPHKSGDVVADMSTIGYGDPSKLVARLEADGYNYTGAVDPNPWISLDLGINRALLINHYCLKHDQYTGTGAMCHWELQGKNVGDEKWTVLLKHKNDRRMPDTAYANGDWPVPDIYTPFQTFRIYQTDKNSAGANAIYCIGIELYGTLLQSKQSISAAMAISNAKNAALLAEEAAKHAAIMEKAQAMLRELSANCSDMVHLSYKDAPFDCSGIIYYLGTNQGTSDTFINPHSSGIVVADMSSSKGAGPAGLVSRVQAHNYTDNAPDQWFSIDLGEKKLALLTHYSLKHDGYGGWGALRYWKLEGKIAPDDSWEVIKQYENDTSMADTAYAVATYPLTLENCKSLKPYRQYRIYQTGKSRANNDYIYVCGIEFYGTLFTMQR